MSAKLTIEFHDDHTITYEHRISKDSDERRVTKVPTLGPLDIRIIRVYAGADMTPTHSILLMDDATCIELRRRTGMLEHALEHMVSGVVQIWTREPEGDGNES